MTKKIRISFIKYEYRVNKTNLLLLISFLLRTNNQLQSHIHNKLSYVQIYVFISSKSLFLFYPTGFRGKIQQKNTIKQTDLVKQKWSNFHYLRYDDYVIQVVESIYLQVVPNIQILSSRYICYERFHDLVLIIKTSI